jgi:hypothetical protein
LRHFVGAHDIRPVNHTTGTGCGLTEASKHGGSRMFVRELPE